jgi:hypothetical protein
LILALSWGWNNLALESHPARQHPPINLSRIDHLSPKGRVQDNEYNGLEVIHQLVEMQAQAIPFLIARLDDETLINHHVLDFWSKVTVADIALIILTDFFTDSTWKKTTLPGVGWDEMLERKNDQLTSEEVLRKFLAKHGRKAIKAKWQRIWHENRERLYWDQSQRCFNLRQSARQE